MGNEIILIEDRDIFNRIVKELGGQVFHRTEDKKYYIKPVGSSVKDRILEICKESLIKEE